MKGKIMNGKNGVRSAKTRSNETFHRDTTDRHVARFAAALGALLAMATAPAALAGPEIEVLPLSYDFGEVQIGDSPTTMISMENVGDQTLVVYNIAFQGGDGGASAIIYAPSQPFVLGNGEIEEVEVGYSPAAPPGPDSAVLEIESNAETAPLVQVDLSGTGVDGSVRFVDDDASTNGDGLTWNTAYKYLQDALDATSNGMTILVAGGAYKPDQDEGGNVTPGLRTETFELQSGEGVYGGYRGCPGGDCGGNPYERNITLYETTLSGDLAGNDQPDFVNYDENSYHVVTGNQPDGAILDGFTVRAGNANGSWPDSGGGGFYMNAVFGGNPTIRNCTFTANQALEEGGGMEIIESGEMLVEGCTFEGNTAESGGGLGLSTYAVAVLHGCTFVGNSATYGGGAFCWEWNDVEFLDCSFMGNSADAGGGLMNYDMTTPKVINCVFSGNTATQTGGGMANRSYADPTVINCSFSGNTASTNGAGVSIEATSSPTMANCIFYGNEAGGVQDESAQVYDDGTGTSIMRYSLIQGLSSLAGSGNIDGDPLFVDADGDDNIPGTDDDDLHLQLGSPCANLGNDEEPSLPAKDFEGEARIQQCRVDMGADESPYFQDCNTNGSADACDIQAGTSDDANSNGIPDECEVPPPPPVYSHRYIGASDGGAGDEFGKAVTLGRAMTVTGSPMDTNSNGTNAGAVYIHRKQGEDWVETDKLLAPDGEDDDNFGCSIDMIEKHILVVGACGDDSGEGSAYVYEWTSAGGGTWEYDAKVQAPGGKLFERGFACYSRIIAPDAFVVGGCGAADRPGAVWVFRSTGSKGWSADPEIAPADSENGDTFGGAIAVMDLNTLVIGAEGDSNSNGAGAGSVYLFSHNGASWDEGDKIVAPDGAAGDAFGSAVAVVDVDMIAVGAYLDDDHGTDSGSAYAFTRAEGRSGWSGCKLEPHPDNPHWRETGKCIGVVNGMIAVGAPGSDGGRADSGQVFLFRRDAGRGPGWINDCKLIPDPENPYVRFGRSISVYESMIASGGPGDEGDKNGDAGAVFLFAGLDDCNGNDVIDAYDITGGTSADCNSNGVPDECDLAEGVSPDCNANDVPDECDIAGGTSNDVNTNGVPDECEDCNSNGVFDDLDIAGGTSTDDNLNGVPDECEPATCQPPVEWARLFASYDSSSGQDDAYAVDIDGDVAVVGTKDTEAAYVFRYDGQLWYLETILTDPSSGATPGDKFGQSVGISGDVIVVGAPQSGQHDPPWYWGHVIVFRFNGSEWQYEQRVQGASYPDQGFGQNLAVDGDTLVVGTNTGEAFIFYFDGFNWIWVLRIDDTAGGRTGESVAVDGDTVAFGAPGDDLHGPDTGAVLVYRGSGASWNFEAKLGQEDPGGGTPQLGSTVGVSGDVIVAGAPYDNAATFDSGSAYVFRRSGSSWSQEDKLVPSDPGSEYHFGETVAVWGDAAVIGAPDHSGGDGLGMAYVFRRVGVSDWVQQAQLSRWGPHGSDDLGKAVALSGDTALIGTDWIVPWDSDGMAIVYRGLSDCNANGLLDLCEVTTAFAEDCNANGRPDECDLASGASEDCNTNGLPDECEVDPFADAVSAWATYDAGSHGVGTDPDGYAGAVFDGRYVYFVPSYNGSTASGEVLRYDTQADFANPSAWAAFDVKTAIGAKGGYFGGAFDGRYVYFVPLSDGTWHHGEVLRYDTTADFDSGGSWSTFDMQTELSGALAGYRGVVFDGSYVYFVPYSRGSHSYDYHGNVVRYDTTVADPAFDNPALWEVHDPAAVGTDPDGYSGAAFDGRYVYFAPYYNGTRYHGEVVRYDTTGDFTTDGSWETYDPGANGVGSDPDGYLDAVFDGRYVYFAPFRNGGGGLTSYGEVLRYDTTGDFSTNGPWSTFDPNMHLMTIDANGYDGAAFDGRYVYFVPCKTSNYAENHHGEVLRHDTYSDFSDAHSWMTFDPGYAGVGTDPDGYRGAAFDGQFLYFAPSMNGDEFHGEVLRYDTTAADCNFTGIPDDCEFVGAGDFDGDGDITLDDYAAFWDCLAGPDVVPQPMWLQCSQSCLEVFDHDLDTDVDLADFAGFQQVFAGS